jgi:hypothetical protein
LKRIAGSPFWTFDSYVGGVNGVKKGNDESLLDHRLTLGGKSLWTVFESVASHQPNKFEIDAGENDIVPYLDFGRTTLTFFFTGFGLGGGTASGAATSAG